LDWTGSASGVGEKFVNESVYDDEWNWVSGMEMHVLVEGWIRVEMGMLWDSVNENDH
jgi:hypothetical protein